MGINRFIEAQSVFFEQAYNELKQGKKQTHWMWFIFPQIQGLGSSSKSIYYAIKDLNEAKEYMDNEYLNNNYFTLCNVLLELDSNDAKEIFGYIDYIKLRASLTLFYLVTNNVIIKKVLDKFYEGEFDNTTINILK